MNDTKLYFFGVWANIIRFIGLLVTLLGLFMFLFVDFWWCIIVMGIGIGILFYGNSLRFKYKRKSGYILHSGDN